MFMHKSAIHSVKDSNTSTAVMQSVDYQYLSIIITEFFFFNTGLQVIRNFKWYLIHFILQKLQNVHRKSKFEECITMALLKFQTKLISLCNHIQISILTWLSTPSEIVVLLMEKGSSE